MPNVIDTPFNFLLFSFSESSADFFTSASDKVSPKLLDLSAPFPKLFKIPLTPADIVPPIALIAVFVSPLEPPVLVLLLFLEPIGIFTLPNMFLIVRTTSPILSFPFVPKESLFSSVLDFMSFTESDTEVTWSITSSVAFDIFSRIFEKLSFEGSEIECLFLFAESSPASLGNKSGILRFKSPSASELDFTLV